MLDLYICFPVNWCTKLIMNSVVNHFNHIKVTRYCLIKLGFVANTVVVGRVHKWSEYTTVQRKLLNLNRVNYCSWLVQACHCSWKSVLGFLDHLINPVLIMIMISTIIMNALKV